ncbi:MAG: hypothetical protein QXP69_03615 [Candidatus Nitrosocaldus sp.]
MIDDPHWSWLVVIELVARPRFKDFGLNLYKSHIFSDIDRTISVYSFILLLFKPALKEEKRRGKGKEGSKEKDKEGRKEEREKRKEETGYP